MRRFILSVSAAIVVLGAAIPARGGDDGVYAPNFAVALKGGAWVADVSGVDAAPAYGIELSVDDPYLDPVAGKVRHMVSLNHADQDGLELTTVEWNAHWLFKAKPDLWLGIGPGVGYVWAEGHGVDDSVGVQFGASATYVQGHALFGLESRYQWTAGDSTDNWLTMVKVGYQF